MVFVYLGESKNWNTTYSVQSGDDYRLGSPSELDSLILSNYLDKYAETGNQYVEVLQKIIIQNDLKDFDDAKLLPDSIELESLI